MASFGKTLEILLKNAGILKNWHFRPKTSLFSRNHEITCSVVIIIDLIYLLGVTFEASPSENPQSFKKVDF